MELRRWVLQWWKNDSHRKRTKGPTVSYGHDGWSDEGGRGVDGPCGSGSPKRPSPAGEVTSSPGEVTCKSHSATQFGVVWLKPSTRLRPESDVPDATLKRPLYIHTDVPLKRPFGRTFTGKPFVRSELGTLSTLKERGPGPSPSPLLTGHRNTLNHKRVPPSTINVSDPPRKSKFPWTDTGPGESSCSLSTATS